MSEVLDGFWSKLELMLHENHRGFHNQIWRQMTYLALLFFIPPPAAGSVNFLLFPTTEFLLSAHPLAAPPLTSFCPSIFSVHSNTLLRSPALPLLQSYWPILWRTVKDRRSVYCLASFLGQWDSADVCVLPSHPPLFHAHRVGGIFPERGGDGPTFFHICCWLRLGLFLFCQVWLKSKTKGWIKRELHSWLIKGGLRWRVQTFNRTRINLRVIHPCRGHSGGLVSVVLCNKVFFLRSDFLIAGLLGSITQTIAYSTMWMFPVKTENTVFNIKL